MTQKKEARKSSSFQLRSATLQHITTSLEAEKNKKYVKLNMKSVCRFLYIHKSNNFQVLKETVIFIWDCRNDFRDLFLAISMSMGWTGQRDCSRLFGPKNMNLHS